VRRRVVTTFVTGIYKDAEAANRAVESLIEADFEAHEISVIVADQAGEHEVPVEHESGVKEGAMIGGGLGAALGAIGLTLAASGVSAAPGVAVLVSTQLMAAFAGAVAGGGAGGLVGALAGLGFWKEEAKLHAEDIRGGSVLIGVHAEAAPAEKAKKVFRETGATRVRG
jgi:hypothetical protein